MKLLRRFDDSADCHLDAPADSCRGGGRAPANGEVLHIGRPSTP
jgi:hypothetical protein